MCAHIYINRVLWQVVLVVFSPNLYFSLSAAEVFLMPGKRDKVLTALLVLRYTPSSVAVQEQMSTVWIGEGRYGVGAFLSPSEDFVIATACTGRSCVSVRGVGSMVVRV